MHTVIVVLALAAAVALLLVVLDWRAAIHRALEARIGLAHLAVVRMGARDATQARRGLTAAHPVLAPVLGQVLACAVCAVALAALGLILPLALYVSVAPTIGGWVLLLGAENRALNAAKATLVA